MNPLLVSCVLAVCVVFVSSCASGPESTPSTPPPPPTEQPQGQETQEPELAEASPADSAKAAGASGEASAPAVQKAEVQTLEFKTEIAAPVEKVWEIMFSSDGYTKWTAPFMAGSYFEGSWAEGERIHFLAPGGSGMVAEIAANRPNELMSVKHLGYVANGVEDTTSTAVQSWAPAYENYHFASVEGGTEVTVKHDVLVGFEGYMNNAWPKALAALKALCEAD